MKPLYSPLALPIVIIFSTWNYIPLFTYLYISDPIPIPVPSKYPTILGICVPGYEKVGSYCVLDYLIPSKEKNPESSLPVTTPPPTPTSPPVAATTQSPAPATVSETTPSPVPVASVSATTVAP